MSGCSLLCSLCWLLRSKELVQVRLDLRCARLRKEIILTVTPVLVGPIMFKVLSIIHVIRLAVRRILPWIKEERPVFNPILFFVLSYRSLLLLNEVFVIGSGLHVTVLEGPLIRSPSRICRRDLIMEPRREVVHL